MLWGSCRPCVCWWCRLVWTARSPHGGPCRQTARVMGGCVVMFSPLLWLVIPLRLGICCLGVVVFWFSSSLGVFFSCEVCLAGLGFAVLSAATDACVRARFCALRARFFSFFLFFFSSAKTPKKCLFFLNLTFFLKSHFFLKFSFLSLLPTTPHTSPSRPRRYPRWKKNCSPPVARPYE